MVVLQTEYLKFDFEGDGDLNSGAFLFASVFSIAQPDFDCDSSAA